MTLLSIVNKVLKQTDDSTITTVEGTISDHIATIIDYINEGYKIVWTRAFKNELAEITGTLNINSCPYSFGSSGIQHFKSLGIKGFRPITLVSYNEFQINYYNNIANVPLPKGIPQAGSFFANKLYLFPEPDQAYNLDYTAKALFTPLSLDADIALVCENTLINYARYKIHAYESDPRQSNAINDYQLTLMSFLDSIKDHKILPPMIMPEDAFYE